MRQITPFLWFDGQADEAAKFYTSIFPDSGIDLVTHYGSSAAKASGQAAGSVMTVAFHINGQSFTALNGGPNFTFSEAISFVVACDDQAEIDRLWDALTAEGGKPVQCGWLKDRFGVSWQIVPADLDDLIGDDPARGERVMAAVMTMVKLDNDALRRAAAG